MSLSLHIYAPIETEKLVESLYRPLHSAWDFDDWTGFGFGSRVEDLFSADRTTPDVAATYLDTLRAMRADHHAWYCSHDAQTGYMSLVLSHWKASWPAQIMGFNILRQAFATAGNGDSGYVLAHDFAPDAETTIGAILLRNGSSQVIGPDSEPIAKIISHARPLALQVEAEAAHDSLDLVDQFDELSAPFAHA